LFWYNIGYKYKVPMEVNSMSQQIVLKRTTNDPGIPTTSNITLAGEVAVNLATKKLYVRGVGDDIIELTSQPLDNGSDIEISSAAHDHGLAYDNNTGKWKNSTVAIDTAVAMSVVFGG
jgi:hypothetical protein